MANIKQTDVASDQHSGSSITQAANSGKKLPHSSRLHLRAYSLEASEPVIEPQNASVASRVNEEEPRPQTAAEAGKLSSENEQLRSRSIASAVTALNDFVQNEKRDFEFSVSEEAGVPVVRIINRKSGELIRQIPGTEVVDLARKLNDREPLRLFSALI